MDEMANLLDSLSMIPHAHTFLLRLANAPGQKMHSRSDDAIRYAEAVTALRQMGLIFLWDLSGELAFTAKGEALMKRWMHA